MVHYEGGNNRLALGELDDSQSPRLLAIAEALRAAGMDIDTHRPIRFEVWNKLALIIVASPHLDPDGHAARPGICRTRRCATWRAGCGLEANAIAAGHGIALDAGHRSPSSTAGRGAGSHRPSILQDFDNGRPMEIDAQIVVPMELAHDAGVPVPTLDMLAALMRARARAAGLYAG